MPVAALWRVGRQHCRSRKTPFIVYLSPLKGLESLVLASEGRQKCTKFERALPSEMT